MDVNKQLEDLNEEEAKYNIGGVIFVSVTMVLGIIGNLHVLVIYAFRIKPSNPRTFILFLAVLDFTTSIIGMPFIIVDLRNPLTFSLPAVCKILRFVNYFICLASSFILFIIAIDRYRKVCDPLGSQISHSAAKYLCLVALGISLLLSWPAPVLYGHSTVNTTNPNITGVRCFTEDKFKDTPYQAYFNYVLVFVVFTMFSILVVLYTLIARAITKHTKFINSFKTTRVKTNNSKETSGNKDELILKCDVKTTNDPNANVNTIITSYSGLNEDVNQTYHKGRSKHRDILHFHHIKRTTLTMFLITAFFFISYMPHLILKIVVFVKNDFVTNLNITGKLLYNTFVWCFFINNIMNSFIYGFCDRNFRTEVKIMYNAIFRRNK